ncbi:IS110 family transposase [Coprobacter secundus]|uniref:IS110 family transposase n=1 Tax=Coprobacter secundus subsp. similis TaxID=2751153 RepID=A0A7G1HVT1_9BACT|nr:IS110 family transposase [Coprobacter secundus]BCI62504.1 IS110 family transposase [Coprobacter secundus subsp. similis]
MNYSHFVGLDVGKNTFDASLMSADEKEVSHNSFDNTSGGIQALLAWIASHQLSLSEVLFCAENMGNYVTELSVSSVYMGFSLALVCPLTIKKSIGLQRGKNDRIDARRITDYAVLHYRKLKLYKLPDKDLVRLRGWIIVRDNLGKQKVSGIKLLETFSQMSRLVDVAEPISLLEEQLDSIKEKILKVEEAMEKLIAANSFLYSNYILLRSIKGIGIINAIVLLCVTDNFQRFDDPRKFACYCGVAPFEHTSGISIRGKTQTSPLANKEVKVYLTRAAITAIAWDPQMKAYYKRKVAEGKHKASVINAVRAKIIARAFAVIRRLAPFVTLVA